MCGGKAASRAKAHGNSLASRWGPQIKVLTTADCPVVWAHEFDLSRSNIIAFRPLSPAIPITDKFKSLAIISNQGKIIGSNVWRLFLVTREQDVLEVQSLLPPSHPAAMPFLPGPHLSQALIPTAAWATYSPAVHLSYSNFKMSSRVVWGMLTKRGGKGTAFKPWLLNEAS